MTLCKMYNIEWGNAHKLQCYWKKTVNIDFVDGSGIILCMKLYRIPITSI